MDDRTLTALKGSIEKWEKIVAGTGSDLGMDNCPLCQEFVDREDDDGDCTALLNWRLGSRIARGLRIAIGQSTHGISAKVRSG